MLADFYRIMDHSQMVDDNPVQVYNHIKKLFQLELNPSHPVYKGHFPGTPVVPGACQVQIIKELVGLILEKEVSLVKSDNIKFLSMIDPFKIPLITISIEIKYKEENQWDVNAVISRDQLVFIKFKGLFMTA